MTISPCPFCGSKSTFINSEEISVIDRDDPSEMTIHFVSCDNCGAQGPATSLSEETAISLWNKRVNFKDTSKTDLKPCPFCGHEQPVIHCYDICDDTEKIDDDQISEITCAEPECQAIGPIIGNGSMIDLWNNRAK